MRISELKEDDNQFSQKYINYLNEMGLESHLDFKKDNFKKIVDDEITKGFNEFYYGNEGAIWDTTKAVGSGVKLAAKGVVGTHKMMSKGTQVAQDMWKKYKPVLIKLISDIGNNMSNMYHKFMKTDELAKDLKGQIDNYINNKIPKIGNVKKSHIMLWNVEQKFIIELVKHVNDYNGFHETVINNIKAIVPHDMLSQGKILMEPEHFVNSLKSKDMEQCTKIVQTVNGLVSELNINGDLTILQMLFRNYSSNNNFYALLSQEPMSFKKGLFANAKIAWNKASAAASGVKNTFTDKTKKVEGMSLQQATKILMFGGSDEQIRIEFSGGTSDVDKFKKIMLQPSGTNVNGYLVFIRNMLMNNTIEKSMKGSGMSLTKRTKELTNQLEKLSQFAEEIDNTIGKTKEQEENKQQNTKPTSTNEFGIEEEPQQEIHDETEVDAKNASTGYTSYLAVTNAYQQAYCSLLNKILNSYKGICSGMLTGAFDLTNSGKSVMDFTDIMLQGNMNQNTIDKNVQSGVK